MFEFLSSWKKCSTKFSLFTGIFLKTDNYFIVHEEWELNFEGTLLLNVRRDGALMLFEIVFQ